MITTSDQRTLHAYSNPRNCHSISVPLAVQSTYLRSYASKIGYIFVLPRVEWCMEGVYLELFRLATDPNVYQIAMLSFHMMPYPDALLSLLTQCSDVTYHFVLENQVVPSNQLLHHMNQMRQPLYNNLSPMAQ